MINIQITPATPIIKQENVLDTLLDELQTFTNPNSIDKKDLNRSSSTDSKTDSQRKTIELTKKKNGK